MVRREQISVFRNELAAELANNILPYWSEKMIDDVNGGFYGRRDGYDKLYETADKGVILNTRILWTFSQASRMISPRHLPVAQRAYTYLLDFFVDKKNGGVYWMLDYKGKPVNTKKQIYAQAFAIYALSEYYLATKDNASLDLAIVLYELIERKSFDHEHNGYLEAFDEKWKLLEDLRLSDKDANEKKTMNTHLHLLEAYTNLYRCWPDPSLLKQLQNLISIFEHKIINKQIHFGLFFDEQWNIKSDVISYGHDIEGSWLLYEASEVTGDETIVQRVRKTCVQMVDAAISEGLDADGGLRNESHDADKHWWPQAEALVGLVNAWQLSGADHYLDTAFQVWGFIKSNLIDQPNGEWYWGINRKGEVIYEEDKAGPWKCPYHNGRAVFELLKRLPESPGKS